ncbi:MAG: YggS family pyridoxal phosphate-dependent enzyme [Chloroflexi bacterium]|nr:YggS family pyridoxal phosphate-dependent enzyme [Chloroflexota bacterium]MYE32978.1 YggS family pyridoxal phosphate-dependent enzyme [Chloroflexota bacterium]
MTTTAATVATRLEVVREHIAAACERAGRDPGEITIVGVTKTHPVDAVEEALAAGQADLGENRAQELVPKAEEAADMGLAPRWHFIGGLQRNKVRQVLPHIAVLHSLDSLRLAAEIEKRAEQGRSPDPDVPLPCYLEVNVGGEASKQGVVATEVGELLRGVADMRHVDVIGLMTVAPQVDDPEQVRPVFRELRELARAHGLDGLSMGMTEDYEVAIEEGATVLRLGRVIFGPRRSLEG